MYLGYFHLLASPLFCEQCCHEHPCAGFVWKPVFASSGYLPRSGIAGSHHNSVFNQLRDFFTGPAPFYVPTVLSFLITKCNGNSGGRQQCWGKARTGFTGLKWDTRQVGSVLADGRAGGTGREHPGVALQVGPASGWLAGLSAYTESRKLTWLVVWGPSSRGGLGHVSPVPLCLWVDNGKSAVRGRQAGREGGGPRNSFVLTPPCREAGHQELSSASKCHERDVSLGDDTKLDFACDWTRELGSSRFFSLWL